MESLFNHNQIKLMIINLKKFKNILVPKINRFIYIFVYYRINSNWFIDNLNFLDRDPIIFPLPQPMSNIFEFLLSFFFFNKKELKALI